MIAPVIPALLAAFRIAGLGLALVLLLSWIAQPVPLAVKILPALLCALAILKPGAGLMVLAGIGPMANAISLWSQSPLQGIRLLEQLILAVVFGAGLRWWRGTGPHSRIAAPALLAAASAIGSFIAIQPVLLLQRFPDISVRQHLRALLINGDYFLRSSLWDPLFFAALAVEGLALAVVAERIVRRDATAAASMVRMAVAGHAGVAAMNMLQIVGAAIRSGDAWRELPRIVRDVRVSLFYDVNAAGSVFVLNLLAGVGLVKMAGRYAWTIVILLAVVAAGLWMAGSRMAMASLAVTICGLLVVAALRRPGPVRRTAVAALIGLALVAILAVAFYPSGRSVGLGTTLTTRRIMAVTSWNMWRSAPLFGVGIGRFYEESARFGGEALKREVAYYIATENAHNNFLQTLATEGIAGLAAMLLLLGAVLAPAIRSEREASSSLRYWLLAGLTGYLLTWLTGHPQLVPEASFAFFLFFGIIVALTPPVSSAWWRAPFVLAAVLLIATAPLRTSSALRQADLEHVAAGLSPWQPEIDGIRYRLAGRSFALYLPGDGASVDLPLRRAPAAPDPLVVAIRFEGVTLYEPLLSGDSWQQIRLQLPRASRRFARVDFEVRAFKGEVLPEPVLYVGKTEPR